MIIKKMLSAVTVLLFICAAAVAQQSRSAPVAAVDVDMVLVEGGMFVMGCPEGWGAECGDDDEWGGFERVTRCVTLDSYYIGKYEVTQELWETVMGSNPSKYTGNKSRPVETVSWTDAQSFIKKLNDMTGKAYRLPTEAEWEFAARGGLKDQGHKFSGSGNAGDVAWYGANSPEINVPLQGKSYSQVFHRTNPVGLKKANELGIHDMSGNVSEWVSDRYGAYVWSAGENNPKGPSDGSLRARRGGEAASSPRDCRVTKRQRGSPDMRNERTGLRLAMDAPKTASGTPAKRTKDAEGYDCSAKPRILVKADSLEAARSKDRDIVSGGGTPVWKYGGVTITLEKGTLTVSGSGDMPNFDLKDNSVPYREFRNDVKSVVIRRGVTSVGDRAFSQCENLTSVTVPDGVTSIGDYAFHNCHKLASITFPKSLKTIGKHAFHSTALTEAKIPEGVTDIRQNAFMTTEQMKSVSLPSTLRTLGSTAFCHSGLTSLKFPRGLEIIERDVCSSCPNLGEVIIPEGVKTIDSYAFNSSGITSVTIPSTVTKIGSRAFSFTQRLTSVTIPSGVKEIQTEMFLRSGLNTITIPETVTEIKEKAFEGCANLTTVISKNPVPPSIRKVSTFSGVPLHLAVLHVPENSVDAYRGASGWRDFPNIRGDLPAAKSDVRVTVTRGTGKEEPAKPAGTQAAAASSPKPSSTKAGGTIDELIAKHRELTKKGDLAGAGKVYQSIMTDYPTDHRAWWYTVAVSTQEFTMLLTPKSGFDSMFEMMKKDASPETYAKYQKDFAAFIERMEQKLDDGLTKAAKGGEADWQIEMLKTNLDRTQPRKGAGAKK